MSEASAPPRKLALIAAFAALYLIWGSTYLGIRFAIESIPPLLMAGTRFFSRRDHHLRHHALAGCAEAYFRGMAHVLHRGRLSPLFWKRQRDRRRTVGSDRVGVAPGRDRAD